MIFGKVDWADLHGEGLFFFGTWKIHFSGLISGVVWVTPPPPLPSRCTDRSWDCSGCWRKIVGGTGRQDVVRCFGVKELPPFSLFFFFSYVSSFLTTFTVLPLSLFCCRLLDNLNQSNIYGVCHDRQFDIIHNNSTFSQHVHIKKYKIHTQPQTNK